MNIPYGRGENHRCAKISEQTAQSILDMKGTRRRAIDVAALHGVKPSMVASIWAKRSWAHLRRRENADYK